MAANTFKAALEALAEQICGPGAVIEGLNRLSGGASQETWSFDVVASNGLRPLILRRAPGGGREGRTGTAIPLATEAALIRLAATAEVKVPPIIHVLNDAEGLGEGYLMSRIEGETIARKILRDDVYATARGRLAFECGEALANIHKIDAEDVSGLQVMGLSPQLQTYFDLYDGLGEPHPVFELAFRWLDDNKLEEVEPKLVHGDFRNGNLIVGEDGLRAVLDWELAHLGDPAEDLGWICVNSWRFGESHNRVGGFGTLNDLLAGYTAAGGADVTPEQVQYWEVFGTLKWGIMCMLMVSAFRSGIDRSIERAAIGRRASETEIDLMNLLARDA